MSAVSSLANFPVLDLLAKVPPGTWEADVLRHMHATSYEAAAAKFGISRGKVYDLALEYEARKNEPRLRERAQERKRRQREFLQEVLNATRTCDVLDFLDGLPSESVPLQLTSPPYNVGRPYGGHGTVDTHRFHYYLGWMLMVLSQLARTLQPGGVLALQVGSTKTDAGELYPLDILFFDHLRAMGLTFQTRIIWEIPHGLTPKRRPADRHETVLVFSKGEPRWFNANAARVPQKQPSKRAFKGPNKGQLSGHPLGAWPPNVWRITNVSHGRPERTGHPAQFPKELARRLVLLYTMPGDLVCDPFVGSGTTAVVAKQTGRAFTGCDLFYGDVRRERLARVVPDLATALPGVTAESVAVWQAEARVVRHDAEPVAPSDLILDAPKVPADG